MLKATLAEISTALNTVRPTAISGSHLSDVSTPLCFALTPAIGKGGD
jgi:hypothetical protein